MRSSNFLFALSRLCVCLLVFLVPILVCPWTTNMLETSKQLLLVLLSFAALTAWLGSMAAEGRARFRSGWVVAFPAFFLAATIVSAAFSNAGPWIWLGRPGQEYEGVLTCAALVAFCYTLSHVADSASMRRRIILCTLTSAFVSGVIGVSAMFGWHLLPFDAAGVAGFNTVGSVDAFSLYLQVAMFIGWALWIGSARERGTFFVGSLDSWVRLLTALVSALALFVALVGNFPVVWIVDGLGAAFLVALAITRRETIGLGGRLAFPITLFVLSIVFLFVRFPFGPALPTVVSPSYETSWNVAESTLAQGSAALWTGSGPGTFAFDYAKFRPVEINQSAFWNLRFDRSNSHAVTLLTTTGLLGAGAWLLLIVVLIVYGIRRLLTKDRDDDAKTTVAAGLVGFVVLSVAHMLHSSDMTLTFLTWACAGLIFSHFPSTDFDLRRSPRTGLISSFVLVIVLLGSLGASFLLVNRFVAETAFARAVSLSRAGADPSGVIGELEYASSRYSWSDAYERSLSVAFLNQATSRAGEFAAKQDASSAAREEVSSLVASSVNAAKRATELGPDDVLNWAGRGTVYRDVMGSVPNAEDFAAASFKQAALFEPANPSHLVDLARVYLMVADRARSMSGSDDSAVVQAAKRAEIDQLAAAEKALQAAIDLKRDYAPAYYYLAATLERQGRLDEAASRIAGLRDANPNDVSLGFQLAMLYLRGGHDDLATVELERVLSINPNHSNALWYLSALYERAGDLEQAIRLAERVAELNPDNAAVRQRVEQLKAGKAAAEIPVPIEEEIIE